MPSRPPDRAPPPPDRLVGIYRPKISFSRPPTPVFSSCPARATAAAVTATQPAAPVVAVAPPRPRSEQLRVLTEILASRHARADPSSRAAADRARAVFGISSAGLALSRRGTRLPAGLRRRYDAHFQRIFSACPNVFTTGLALDLLLSLREDGAVNLVRNTDTTTITTSKHNKYDSNSDDSFRWHVIVDSVVEALLGSAAIFTTEYMGEHVFSPSTWESMCFRRCNLSPPWRHPRAHVSWQKPRCATPPSDALYLRPNPGSSSTAPCATRSQK